MVVERDELKDRLHQEMGKVEEFEHNATVRARCQANLPKTIMAKYVQSPDFEAFVSRLTLDAFHTGALKYKEVMLQTQSASMVEATDEAVSTHLIEANMLIVPLLP